MITLEEIRQYGDREADKPREVDTALDEFWLDELATRSVEHTIEDAITVSNVLQDYDDVLTDLIALNHLKIHVHANCIVIEYNTEDTEFLK